MLASENDSGVYDYEPAGMDADRVQGINRSVSAGARPQALPRPTVIVEQVESPPSQRTRIVTDSRGQRTLINDMRASNLRTGQL